MTPPPEDGATVMNRHAPPQYHPHSSLDLSMRMTEWNGEYMSMCVVF